MERSEAERLHRTATADLVALRGDLEELRHRESSLIKFLEGLEGLFPGLDAPHDTNQNGKSSGQIEGLVKTPNPRGKEAVIRVLADHPESYLTVAEILEAQAKRGWVNKKSARPGDAVRTTLGRMRKSKEVERRKRGNAYAYRLKDKLDAQIGTEASSSSLAKERTEDDSALTE